MRARPGGEAANRSVREARESGDRAVVRRSTGRRRDRTGIAASVNTASTSGRYVDASRYVTAISRKRTPSRAQSRHMRAASRTSVSGSGAETSCTVPSGTAEVLGANSVCCKCARAVSFWVGGSRAVSAAAWERSQARRSSCATSGPAPARREEDRHRDRLRELLEESATERAPRRRRARSSVPSKRVASATASASSPS